MRAGPGPALVHWLKEQTAARTLAQLVPVDATGDLVSESTIKRWSSGATFPSEREFRTVAESGLSSQGNERRDDLLASARWLFFAARRLDKTLRLAEPLFKAPSPDAPALTSWGGALLNADDALDWARRGYDRWFDHWVSRDVQPSRI